MKAKYTKFHGNDKEDKVLYENFTLPDKGVFVDIGAGPDGIQGSNSYFFEKNGWKCVVVDADPRNKEALLKNRKHAYSLAIGSKPGMAKLHMHDSPDISVLSDAGTQDVEVVTLESILEKENIDKIDILSIDTEGTEIEVWESFDWKKHIPLIVVVEAVSSQVINEKIPEYFANLGYSYVATIGPNLIYKWVERVRDPKTIVYGSSYDRGLEHLLKMWPDIIKEVPDAKLRIFYGWVMFDKVTRGNPGSLAWKEKMEELMRQPGITHLGRISHQACAVEFQTAGIWAYPCHFGEISCITAMRAQALGAVPVVTDYAALDETVQCGVKVKGDIYEPEVKEDFKKAVISLLKDEGYQEQVRSKMMDWARENFTWAKVAKQWSDEFKSEVSLDKQVETLMDNNQPLDAWNLVKDTDYPKKDKVYAKVRHAFDPEEYRKFYAEDLAEVPVPEELAVDAQRIAPRFGWLQACVEQKKPKSLLDLGCADGYVCLTLATRGIKCTGVNLYQPSIDVATERAKKNKLDCEFICDDLFNIKGKYDAVVLMEVLEHLPDPKKAISHCMSLLNPGGSFYLSTPSPDHLGIELHKNEAGRKAWDEDGTPSGHLKLYSETEIKEMLKDFNIKQMILDNEKCWNVEVTNER